MVRLFDSRLQAVVDVAPGKPGVLSLRLGTPSGTDAVRLEDLRAAVTADVIRRSESLRRTRVVTVETGAARDLARMSADRAALNVHPAELVMSPDEPIALAIDIGVGAPGRHRVDIGSVTIDGQPSASADSDGSLPARMIARGLDPLTLRLAFLQTRCREPLHLTWEELATADAALTRWRRAVAVWATAPSAAMPGDRVAAILRAVEDDLDTALALAQAHDLATATAVGDGAKFETLAYVDRVLGLDLVTLVGRELG